MSGREPRRLHDLTLGVCMQAVNPVISISLPAGMGLHPFYHTLYNTLMRNRGVTTTAELSSRAHSVCGLPVGTADNGQRGPPANALSGGMPAGATAAAAAQPCVGR